MISIEEMLALERFQSFKCIGGQQGINKMVKKISLLDYEIVEQLEDQFFENEFALSSLLGAKNNPELIKSAVEYLHRNGVIGLAVKNIYYETLPGEVVAYCNQYDFPLFIFDNSVFFEDLITDLRDVLRDMQVEKERELQLESLLSGNCSERDHNKLFNDLTDYYEGSYRMIFLSDKKDLDTIKQRRFIESFRQRKSATIKFLTPFRGGYLMCYTEEEVMARNLSSDCAYYGISIEAFYVSMSLLGYGISKFKSLCKQCLWVSRVNKSLGSGILSYESIGIYKLLQHIVDTEEADAYIQEIIEPIKLYDKEHGTELFLTADTFVKAEGQMIETSKALFQHSNTTRYRINKIRQLLNCEACEGSFFESLSIAFKLYDLKE